jgi:hypothetical protein
VATAFTCDGCGVCIDTPKKVGVVLTRDYCERCAKEAEAFLAAEEDNRVHYQRRFMEVRGHLINVHGKAGAFKLPDVP